LRHVDDAMVPQFLGYLFDFQEPEPGALGVFVALVNAVFLVVEDAITVAAPTPTDRRQLARSGRSRARQSRGVPGAGRQVEDGDDLPGVVVDIEIGITGVPV